ncbi:MAG: hypothetical protein ACRERU_22750 [Methylococcales bacterium]
MAAIIVSDRVHERQTRGLPGAIRGVRDVALPVIEGLGSPWP